MGAVERRVERGCWSWRCARAPSTHKKGKRNESRILRPNQSRIPEQHGGQHQPVPAASDSWYGEIKDYNFDDLAANATKTVGHFTQLVWKGSVKIGAGRVCGSEDNTWHDTYIAVNFAPAGNMAGAYKDNVLPPKQ
jgi:hypothetical protein